MATTCPNCGTKNRDDATFCENCGHALGAPATGAPPPYARGAAPPPGSTPPPGGPPPGGTPPYYPPPPRRMSTGLMVASIGIVVGLLIAAAAIIYAASGSHGNPSPAPPSQGTITPVANTNTPTPAPPTPTTGPGTPTPTSIPSPTPAPPSATPVPPSPTPGPSPSPPPNQFSGSTFTLNYPNAPWSLGNHDSTYVNLIEAINGGTDVLYVAAQNNLSGVDPIDKQPADQLAWIQKNATDAKITVQLSPVSGTVAGKTGWQFFQIAGDYTPPGGQTAYPLIWDFYEMVAPGNTGYYLLMWSSTKGTRNQFVNTDGWIVINTIQWKF